MRSTLRLVSAVFLVGFLCGMRAWAFDFQVTAQDGKTLEGEYRLPSFGNDRRFPAVLILVGSGPVGRWGGMESIAPVLTKKGFAVFAYDKRGIHSSSNTTQITSDAVTATARNLQDDALKVFDFISAHPLVDPNRILLLAHSEGTVIATHLLESRPTRIRAVMALGTNVLGFENALRFQSTERQFLLFPKIDTDGDGHITESELEQLDEKTDQQFLKPLLTTLFGGILQGKGASEALRMMDSDKSGTLSMAEWRTIFSRHWQNFLNLIADERAPWPIPYYPRQWFREVIANGSNLYRQGNFCRKWALFHGEQDQMTPIAGVEALEQHCNRQGVPLLAIHRYPGRDHMFNEPKGYLGLLPTDSEIDDAKLIHDIETFLNGKPWAK